LTEAEEAQIREESRQIIRQELKGCFNGVAREAFKKLDLNGSGNISCQEFADGLSRIGVNWQKISGMTRPRDIFNLFDEDKDATITFAELFPDDVTAAGDRPSTPQFWRNYYRNRSHEVKTASWSPATCDEELKGLLETTQRHDDATEKRKWMSSTIRRLKTRGKSDCRCREVVALHLPRGTGPKDREGVNTFTTVDLKNCRKVYNDEVNVPMRRMWKVVGDYKDQRREQKRIYDKLYSVTEALVQRQKTEELVNSLGGGLSLLGKFKDDGAPTATANGASASFRSLAQSTGLELEDLQELQKDYLKFADTNEMLGKRGFTRLLQALIPSNQLGDSQADQWWEQILRKRNQNGDGEFLGSDLLGGDAAGANAVDDDKPKFDTKRTVNKMEDSVRSGQLGSRSRQQCNFDQFCMWWADLQSRR